LETEELFRVGGEALGLELVGVVMVMEAVHAGGEEVGQGAVGHGYQTRLGGMRRIVANVGVGLGFKKHARGSIISRQVEGIMTHQGSRPSAAAAI
jgi:hypothetical protein